MQKQFSNRPLQPLAWTLKPLPKSPTSAAIKKWWAHMDSLDIKILIIASTLTVQWLLTIAAPPKTTSPHWLFGTPKPGASLRNIMKRIFSHSSTFSDTLSKVWILLRICLTLLIKTAVKQQKIIRQWTWILKSLKISTALLSMLSKKLRIYVKDFTVFFVMQPYKRNLQIFG